MRMIKALSIEYSDSNGCKIPRISEFLKYFGAHRQICRALFKVLKWLAFHLFAPHRLFKMCTRKFRRENNLGLHSCKTEKDLVPAQIRFCKAQFWIFRLLTNIDFTIMKTSLGYTDTKAF